MRQFKKKIENNQFRILGKPDKVNNYLNYVGLSEREALKDLWKKTYGYRDKDEKQFLKWEKLREKFNFDWAVEVTQTMTLPEDVGNIRKFFP